MFMPSLVLWCLGAFLCGSIPFGLLLVKLAGKGDVREHGSGNIGATNVSRVGGKALGIVTLLLDILKGFLPVYLGKQLGMGESVLSLLALCAVLGHVFTPWLKFQGGKGVATALGVALAFRAAMILPALGVFVVLLLVFRYVSLGSVMAALTLLAVLIWKGGHARGPAALGGHCADRGRQAPREYSAPPEGHRVPPLGRQEGAGPWLRLTSASSAPAPGAPLWP